jgi:hypothetical protein
LPPPEENKFIFASLVDSRYAPPKKKYDNAPAIEQVAPTVQPPLAAPASKGAEKDAETAPAPTATEQVAPTVQPLLAASGPKAPAKNAEAAKKKRKRTPKGHMPAQAQQAVEWLIGKDQILEVLKQTEDRWPWILRLNGETGPIKTRKGGKSVAEKTKLISWWAKMEKLYADSGNRGRNKAAVRQGIYAAGKTDIAPDVSGSVHPKRKPRKVTETS